MTVFTCALARGKIGMAVRAPAPDPRAAAPTRMRGPAGR
jgi:hypothetical protein